MNPLIIWTSLTPWTKRIIIISLALIIIVSMITGYFPELIGIFKGSKK